MISNLDNKDCTGCFACQNICPTEAIKMIESKDGFLYPKIDKEKCVNCDVCEKVCPVINTPSVSNNNKYYALKLKNVSERKKSSSGGAFYAFAKYILDENGVVYGAAYDEDLCVRHIAVHNLKELENLRGSKYVQSIIGNTYYNAKKDLIEGKKVLFSGTACQIAGLKKYLGKDYINLLCIDLICHGVPSPKVWKRYIDEISGEKRLVKVIMRDKSNNGNLSYFFDGGSQVTELRKNSLFMQGFLKNLYLRQSCYNCHFKGISRCSDITIGDDFGVIEYNPEFSDGYGTSSLIIHTDNGMNLIDKLTDVSYISIEKKELLCWNEHIVESAVNNPNRNEFMNLIDDKIEICELINNNIINSNPSRKEKIGVFYKIKRIIKRVISLFWRNEIE